MNKAVYVDDYELIYYNLNFMTSLAQKLEIKVIQLIPYTSQCQMLQLRLRPLTESGKLGHMEEHRTRQGI